MRFLVLAMALHGLAGLLAMAIACRRTQYRAIAFFLFGTALADVIHAPLGIFVLLPARAALPAAVPLTGWVRLIAHVDAALFLTWYAGLAALALVLFSKLRPWPVACVWAATAIGIALAYPLTRGDVLRRVYLAADLAALMVAVACFASWLRSRLPQQSLTFAQLIAVMILLTEVGTLFFGAWRKSIFDNWSLSQVAYATLYAVCITLQGGVLWNTPSHSPSPPDSSD